MGLEASDSSTVLTSNRSPCSVESSSCWGHEDAFGLDEDKDESSSGLTDRLQRELSSVWRAYQSLVRKHHLHMELADGTIHRLLFWLPHHDNSGDGPPWREVLYGLLSVNQLAMHCSQHEHMENSYGFSLSTRNEPCISATSWRIALNVLHCLMPSILEIAASRNRDSNTAISLHRHQGKIRLRLEQVKFLIRLYLLLSYWKQSKEESPSNKNAGIMLDGGLYHPRSNFMEMSEEELKSVQQRRGYQGRRTGLRISQGRDEAALNATPPSSLRVLLAELLYMLRPVWWAAAEARHDTAGPGNRIASISSDPLFKSWLVTFGMDLLSLGLLSGLKRSGNPHSKEEWNRRRMKLFLYLLRAPIWNRVTSPTLEAASAMALRVPLLGRLVDSYLWDWVLYWKHPYVSEEG